MKCKVSCRADDLAMLCRASMVFGVSVVYCELVLFDVSRKQPPTGQHQGESDEPGVQCGQIVCLFGVPGSYLFDVGQYVG